MIFQKGVTAYMGRKAHKFPKRSLAKAGNRARSYFDSNQRRLFDKLGKQYYYDLIDDTHDGNDKPNFKGILTGSDIPAADAFFDVVYSQFMAAISNEALGGADDNILLDTDEDAE